MPYEDRDYSNNSRQKDLVLATNEYVYIQNLTNGQIKTYTGPIMLTISQQESLVVFDSKTKRFRETTDFEKAKRMFVSAPENWYIILKNPAKDNIHPESGKANTTVELNVGQKTIITGPTTFSLWPGQMAKVIKGHTLRSNQYLLARVYEATAANANQGIVFNADGKEVEDSRTSYVNGQLLVIKGTEVSFYIPPTGIEIIPIEGGEYVRDAVTLERLEYCILKDEDGNKRYVHGPAVVFPKPTESFVTSPKGGVVYRAIELSPISGIYVKVIAAYKDETGTEHPVGEELFITGNDQMIYYPRPEHTLITYDGKFMHHAIAIPEGEGRYILNRLTGDIKTVKGPAMYLPDPRTEVVVKRKLSAKQCELWYPGNAEALAYNMGLTERSVEKAAAKDISLDNLAFNAMSSVADSLAYMETKASISRGTSYTKPRTITLDTKFEGVVTMDVWTGYAVKVISKDGTREVICGPQTILLDYDQTLEEISLSTGKPKTTDHMINTVFLRYKNNRVSDIINVVTKDYVNCTVKVSYSVDFDEADKDKWFDVDNYVKHLCDRERSLMKAAVKNYNIQEFYNNYSEIIHNIAVAENEDHAEGDTFGRYFSENGMRVIDCEVLSIKIDKDVEEMLINDQRDNIKNQLQLQATSERIQVLEKLAIAEKKEAALKNQKLIDEMNLQREEALRKLEIQNEVNRKKEAEQQAQRQAERDSQELLDAVQAAKLARQRSEQDLKLAIANAEADIEKARQDAYAETVQKIMASIQPDLVAALNAKSNADIMNTVAHAVGPYAIAENESIADTANKLLRGTSLEGILANIGTKED